MVCSLILLLGIDCLGFKHAQFHISWLTSTFLCIMVGKFFSKIDLIDIFVITNIWKIVDKNYF